MTVSRQSIVYLVEGDYGTGLRLRFDGMDLNLYDSVTLIVSREDGTRFRRSLEVDLLDPEAAIVIWQAGDLVAGRHQGEFEFIGPGDQRFTLPAKYTVIFEVRKDLL